MRFNCGENWRAERVRLENWHPFFPLWPRTIATENGVDICAWLEWIERKGTLYSGWDVYVWEWEYRPRQDVPTVREK